MKKRIFVVIMMVLSLVVMLCACNKNNTNEQELTVKLDNCTVTLSTSEDYLLEVFNEDKSIGFAVFYNDEEAENFAIGSFLSADAFAHFRLAIVEDEDVQTVYENTDNLIYYSVLNADNASYTEYNRIIKLNDDYIMYLGSFDQEAVDAFYETLNVQVK